MQVFFQRDKGQEALLTWVVCGLIVFSPLCELSLFDVSFSPIYATRVFSRYFSFLSETPFIKINIWVSIVCIEFWMQW